MGGLDVGAVDKSIGARLLGYISIIFKILYMFFDGPVTQW